MRKTGRRITKERWKEERDEQGEVGVRGRGEERGWRLRE